MTQVPSHIGPYQITREIGRGGMGVVYLARDTKLDRDVAIKCLPDEFAQDEDRLHRFEREAKLLASLNHPNIASIYGLEEVDGKRYLILEYVEGETLEEKLSAGAIPVDEALVIAKQIAEAIEAAHEKGVIHRDLKPANIKFTSEEQVKVLDFGLAKAIDDRPSSITNIADSPTVMQEASPTLPGVILGTAGYLSPEQARGRPVDKRTDIFSFGCVLYEMLTGLPPFPGETPTDSIGAALHMEPDWEQLPPNLPPTIHVLLRRCLSKDRKQRLQDIGDARLEIGDVLSGAALLLPSHVALGHRDRRRTWLRNMVASFALLLLASTVTWLIVGELGLAEMERHVRRFEIVDDDLNLSRSTAPRISPDGKRIVYSSHNRLWLRDLDRIKPREITGTRNALHPFWSPDSMELGFEKDGVIWKIAVDGGEPTAICTLTRRFTDVGGASWREDGTIVFTRGGTSDALWQVSARGGDPIPVLQPDGDAGEQDFHEPTVLSEGTVLFIVHGEQEADSIAVLIGNRRKVVLTLEGEQLRSPAYSVTGHLLYYRGTTIPGIWAVPFSLTDLETTAEPFLIAPDCSLPSVASDGTLVYVRGEASNDRRQLVQLDRKGTVIAEIGEPQRGMMLPALSPDQKRVSISISVNETRDIWIYNVANGLKTKFTFTPGEDWLSCWSSEGDELMFYTEESGQGRIYVKSSDGTGSRRELITGTSLSLSPDGKLIYGVSTLQGSQDLWYRQIGSDSPPVSLNITASQEQYASVSPDGHYLAYVSQESGKSVVYLKRFPSGDGGWTVSEDRGEDVRWAAGSEEGEYDLFYNHDNALMVVRVRTKPSLSYDAPELVFSAGPHHVELRRGYDVSPDGQYFIAIQDEFENDSRGITVVENWYEEFRQR